MQGFKMLLSVAFLSMPVLVPGAAFAQDETGANLSDTKPDKVSDSDQATARYSLAQEVADYGRESGAAVALLLAGEMVRGIDVTEVTREKTSETVEQVADAGQGDTSEAPLALDSDMLFAEARRLAGPDQALLARIDRAANQSLRGRIGGPTVHYDRVNARTRDVYNISFRGGNLAHLAVRGDGDTDVDLFVYDENGNLVCSDTDSSDNMHCDWTPSWTGNFRVVLDNLGSVYNAYRLETN